VLTYPSACSATWPNSTVGALTPNSLSKRHPDTSNRRESGGSTYRDLATNDVMNVLTKDSYASILTI
jgi:hypothetical protein